MLFLSLDGIGTLSRHINTTYSMNAFRTFSEVRVSELYKKNSRRCFELQQSLCHSWLYHPSGTKNLATISVNFVAECTSRVNIFRRFLAQIRGVVRGEVACHLDISGYNFSRVYLGVKTPGHQVTTRVPDPAAVLWIPDILVWIRIRGPVPLTHGSDPVPAPDPHSSFYVNGWQDANKKVNFQKFFAYYLHLHQSSKEKSQK